MKHILTLLLAVLFALPCYAGELAPQGPFRALDSNGDPCTSCKLYTYEAGTTTNKTTYTDASEAIPNANPVVLDSDGYGDVWLGDGSYKFVLKDSSDATIWTVDDIGGIAANAFGDQITTLSANTTITTAYENYLVLTTSSPTLSLLSAASAGEGFTFAVKNTDSGTTTIDPDGSETIDGNASATLEEGEGIIIFSDGTNWVTLLEQTVKLTQDNTFTATNTFSGTTAFDGKITWGDDGEQTINTGAVTLTGVFHTFDTESDAASDDLDTITTTANGLISLWRAENASRTVVAKHNTGNIFNPNAVDITLDDTDRIVGSIYDSALSKHVILFDGTTREYVDSAMAAAQIVTAEYATYTSTTTVMPFDDSIPQNTEGTEILTQAFTPTNASSTILIEVEIPVDVATSTNVCGAVFVDSTADALGAGWANPSGGGGGDNLSFSVEVAAGDTSARTYKLRVGPGVTGTVYINGSSSNRIFGGVSKVRMKITEILP